MLPTRAALGSGAGEKPAARAPRPRPFPSGRNHPGRARAGAPAGWRETLFLAALTALVLLPVAGKAFHIDDTLFLKAARQIRAHLTRAYELNEPKAVAS